jgi:hypothetical protein
MSSMQIEMPALGGVVEAQRAQAVGEEHRLLVAVHAVADVDQVGERLLVPAPC